MAGTVVGPAAQVPLPDSDWPQFGRDAQRTGFSPLQIDPPYCFAWKWYEAPLASRAQPVVAGGRLFIGSMDGVVYARDAATGAPVWESATGGPIRHSPAVAGAVVVTGSHDGYTWALRVTDGTVAWKSATGASATAPLVDPERGRVFVGSTSGTFWSLEAATGNVLWSYQADAAILTTPSLSADGALVLLGTERVALVALDAASGQLRWSTPLHGQSLADRAPVVAGQSVVVRSQPLDFFHSLLHDGDDVMDSAGARVADWTADWTAVRPRIFDYLRQQPTKQTFFVADLATGTLRGPAPVLYTYGNNDVPASPVVRGTELFVPFRARHGIQTDSPVAIHVSSRYDGELGRLDLSTLDLTLLRHAAATPFAYQFRLTSDEPAALTMSGDNLLVDNWERLGAINVRSGTLVHLAAVSNDWPECFVQCGPGSDRTFFPLSGSGPAYPFPSPRVTEGHQRPGAVVAAGAVYWRVIQGGLAAIVHRSGAACPEPRIWTAPATQPGRPQGLRSITRSIARDLADYVHMDLQVPADSPPQDLVARLRTEVQDLVSAGGHLTPFYLERGMTNSALWPRRTSNPPGPPIVSYRSHGNASWHDQGELVYTLALAYPYLDAPLQAATRSYVAGVLARYPMLKDLPWGDLAWLRRGTPREPYAVAFREQVSTWPPPGADLNAITALWLWAKNTHDWTLARTLWPDAKRLFEARQATMDYYADIGGAVAYAKLASLLGDESAEYAGRVAALDAMQVGRDFESFRARAEKDYLDPRNQQTGLYAPVFFGITPEVGLYLREQVGVAAVEYLRARTTGNGLRWWYLTRVGAHAEIGETSYAAPIAAWSHFMAQAYVLGASQADLRRWLDRPWGRGDVYSIQKLVATIQAR